MRGRNLHLGITVAAVLSCLVLVPVARAETEPNDNILQANVITDSNPVTGMTNTPQDVDWYEFSLGSQQQVTLNLSVGSVNCGVFFDFRDYRGQSIDNGILINEELSPSEGAREEYHYTTAYYSGIYYLAMGTGQPGCEYAVSMSPNSAFAPLPAPLPMVEVPEPNDLQSQAYGPMKAGTLYAGTIDTENDVEWLYFYVRGHHRAQLQMTDARCSTGEVRANLTTEERDGAKEEIYDPLEVSREGHESLELDEHPAPLRYWVKVTGHVGCYWQLELSPAESLFSSFAKQGSRHTGRHDACRVARRGLKRRRIRLHRAERTLRFTHSRHGRARLHHKIEARKRAVRASRHSIRVHCNNHKSKVKSRAVV